MVNNQGTNDLDMFYINATVIPHDGYPRYDVLWRRYESQVASSSDASIDSTYIKDIKSQGAIVMDKSKPPTLSRLLFSFMHHGVSPASSFLHCGKRLPKNTGTSQLRLAQWTVLHAYSNFCREQWIIYLLTLRYYLGSNTIQYGCESGLPAPALEQSLKKLFDRQLGISTKLSDRDFSR
jgi:hypothetical protein